MLPAAPRLIVGLVLAFVAGCSSPAAEAAPRAAPSRPAAAPPAAPVKYVSLATVAAQLQLGISWTVTGRKVTLSDRKRRLELEADSREIAVNGLRVFLGSPVLARSSGLYLTKTDFERCVGPLLRPVLAGVPLRRVKTIALDPGHGGNDNGMENTKLGLKEKELTLDVALRLEKILEARGYRVVLTRTSDKPLSSDKKTDLKRRAEIANHAGADLFVSIHFNSLYPDMKTSGTEVYVFTRAGQRSDLSAGFGQKDDSEDPSPANRYDAWSAILGHAMHREVIAGLRTLDRGQKTMHSAVLRDLDCPGVLVESLFLSNEAEAKRAATPAYRERIAAALAAGIAEYAGIVDLLVAKK